MCIYVGIDIGKFTIHYYYRLNNEIKQGDFANTQEAIKAFIDALPMDSHCILEATGVYNLPLCFALSDAQKAFTILNPSVSSAFAKSLNSISKTDKIDSAILARFGQERQPATTILESPEWYAFRQLINRWQTLQTKKQALDNQLLELAFYPEMHAVVVGQMHEEQVLLDGQIEQLIQTIEQDIPQDYHELIELGSSVKGIGKKTALHLIFFTQGLEAFDNAKQLSKYIGIAPNVYQSGRSQKKGHICKRGNPQLRSLLYNCAKSATRFNPACKELYQRLRQKGKAHKVAMVAVMHKLVKQFFAIIKSGKPYQNDFHINIQKTT